jgi:hypothetical protein
MDVYDVQVDEKGTTVQVVGAERAITLATAIREVHETKRLLEEKLAEQGDQGDKTPAERRDTGSPCDTDSNSGCVVL